MPNDMDNFMEYHVMGSVSQVRMKPGCIPTKFDCQSDSRKHISNTTEQHSLKKQRKVLIGEYDNDLEEDSVIIKQEIEETSCISSDGATQEGSSAQKLPNDMANYLLYYIMGSVNQSVPSKFDFPTTTSSSQVNKLKPREEGSHVLRTIIKQELQENSDGTAENDASTSIYEDNLCGEAQDSIAASEETFVNVADNEEIVVKEEHEIFFATHIKTEPAEQTEMTANIKEIQHEPFNEDTRIDEENNVVEKEIAGKAKKVAKRKKELKDRRKISCSAKVYQNALATAVSKIIARVYNFFMKEFEYLSKTYGGILDLGPFCKYTQRTAEATGFHEAVIERALREEGEEIAFNEEEERGKTVLSEVGEGKKIALREEGQREVIALREERQREVTAFRVEGQREKTALREEGKGGKIALREERQREVIGLRVEGQSEKTALREDGEGGKMALRDEGERGKISLKGQRGKITFRKEGQRDMISARGKGHSGKTALTKEGQREEIALRKVGQGGTTCPRKRRREEETSDSQYDSETDSSDESSESSDVSGPVRTIGTTRTTGTTRTSGTTARRTMVQHIPRINRDHPYALAPIEATATVKSEPLEELHEPKMYASPIGATPAYVPLRQMATENDPLKIEPDN